MGGSVRIPRIPFSPQCCPSPHPMDSVRATECCKKDKGTKSEAHDEVSGLPSHAKLEVYVTCIIVGFFFICNVQFIITGYIVYLSDLCLK